ncbi:hypothetical protein BDV97DRAFT_397371 [Delphinella strobiligena]|nr:hypothetical protein BDV97DRAFT_397371 [Delphinella strobiligena]
MPPLRNLPAAKPLKTERTHEENQERAYIAASRRSDRSLEARVESARRASEIHKRRTGRSLRVTEQDVVNEEMYEEEDDDLPMQYRRLTAHLQTTNADFDRRLAAYLTNHVAMRTALGAAVSENYVHPQYTNAPQFANQMSQFPQQHFNNSMLPPQAVGRSPQNFRQSPYIMPNQQPQRQHNHNRSASEATPHDSPTPQSPANTFIKPGDRRFSLQLPPRGMSTSQIQMQKTPRPLPSPVISRTSSSSSLANLKYESGHQPVKQDRSMSASLQHQSPTQMKQSTFPNPFSVNPFAFDTTGNGGMVPPFSTALPMESQQLLGTTLESSDPYTAKLLGDQDYRPQQSFYSYNPNGSCQSKSFSPPSINDGMNQTLAPGMLDTAVLGQDNYSTPVSAADSAITPHGGFRSFGVDFSYHDLKTSPSGFTTPGEHDWANFISWEDSSSQHAVA